jgi:hypothetical protein
VTLQQLTRTALVLTCVWHGHAQGATLDWEAPAHCPSAAEVRDQIEDARRQPLDAAPSVALRARVVESAGGELVLTVTAVPAGQPDASGASRTLSTSDCEEAVSALAQVVSLVLGPPQLPDEVAPPAPDDTSSRSEPSPAEDDLRDASTKDPAKAPAPVAADNASRRSPAVQPKEHRPWAFALGPVLDLASFGKPAWGAKGHASWTSEHGWGLRGAFGYLPSVVLESGQEATLPSGEPPQGTVSLALAALLGCRSGSGGVALGLCAGTEVGRLSTAGRGVAYPDSPRAPWLAVRADARGAVHLGAGWRVAGVVSAVVPLLRHEFFLDGVRLHGLPAVAPRLGVALERAL